MTCGNKGIVKTYLPEDTAGGGQHATEARRSPYATASGMGSSQVGIDPPAASHGPAERFRDERDLQRQWAGGVDLARAVDELSVIVERGCCLDELLLMLHEDDEPARAGYRLLQLAAIDLDGLVTDLLDLRDDMADALAGRGRLAV